MAISRRHGIENKREYSGEEICQGFLDWVNEPYDDAGRKRVQELLATYVQHKSNFKLQYDPIEKRRIRVYVGDLHGLLDRLESMCKRYTYYPLFLGTGQKGYEVQWFPASKNKKYAHGWAIEYDEMNAVLDLSRLSQMDLLRRIKKCEYCDRWLFARFEHQRFCSGGKCREKAFRSSPAEKEKRRKWARNYYWIQRHKNVK